MTMPLAARRALLTDVRTAIHHPATRQRKRSTLIMTKPTNPYAHAYAAFLRETAEHQLMMLHDDDLYRHLRIQKPGTRMWSWDITTWPGHLTTSGDIADGYMFTRLEDMIDFFDISKRNRDHYSGGAPSIDVRYWAQKFCGGRSREVNRYDADVFLQLVCEHLAEHEELGDEAQTFHERQLTLLKQLHNLRRLDEAAQLELLRTHWMAEARTTHFDPSTDTTLARQCRDAAAAAIDRLWSADDLSGGKFDRLTKEHDWNELADIAIERKSPAERAAEILADAKSDADSESEAHKRLQDQSEIFGEDTAEWDLRGYDFQFLLTCYGVDLAVRLYRERQAWQAEAPEAVPA
ncbi:hypothetical protein [Streptomyces sp. NBC_01304]|uniref:hypothetical protein n=1 Tax=Streptomyces sp. NBC_01304 TaxID=2903818 RepID=UPI002E160D20|nr:hypothetical protein OG430_41590 [Streptomyces sp. NBC_01304]